MVSKQRIKDTAEDCLKTMPDAFTSADMGPAMTKALGQQVDNRRISWGLTALYQEGKLKKIRGESCGTGNKSVIFMKSDVKPE